MPIEMTPVESTNLAAVGYDRQTQRLRVRFQTGTVYDYYNVSEMHYHMLLTTESKGTYFNEYIRNVFEYAKVEG
jgi:hypothetical protein